MRTRTSKGLGSRRGRGEDEDERFVVLEPVPEQGKARACADVSSDFCQA